MTLNGSNLAVDTVVRDLRNRQVVEELLADPQRGPSERAKKMVEGYVAGVNDWLDSVGEPSGVDDPECRGGAWLADEATPLDLWYGVYLANLLASTGCSPRRSHGFEPAATGYPTASRP